LSILLRVTLALAASVGLATPALARQGPDEAAFTVRMAERARAAFPDRPVEIAEPLALRVGGEADGVTIGLGRVFAVCADSTAEECDAFADDFFATLRESTGQLPPLRPDQLRIMIRHSEYCDELEGATRERGQGQAFVLRPFAPSLCALLVADFPNMMRPLDSDDVSGLALEPDAAWALAERQTLANLPDPETLAVLRDQVVMLSDMDYVPSLLLDLDGWRRASAAVGGDLVVAVPADGMLVAGRLANIGSLEDFKASTFGAFSIAGRGISPLVYRPTDSGWQPVD
jgi:hypothetical protein